jgi:transposase
MKAISTAQYNSVVSLLNEGYSQHQIKEKTGVGKGTIGRISKEVEGNKENNLGGHPFKLSICDKQSIICQIKSGRLDNAVQATQFINGIIPNPVTPQTVRNSLKESQFYAATKRKVPLLK